MATRVLIMCITFIIASQCLVGGVLYVVDNFGDTTQVSTVTIEAMTAKDIDETPSTSECYCDNACCSQATSPLSSSAVSFCCEVVCRVSPFHIPAKQPEEDKPSRIPQPTVTIVKIDSSKKSFSEILLNLHQTMNYPHISDNPPAFYIHNSAFLI